MAEFTVRRPTESDIVALAETMREADVAEVRAATGHTPLEALLEGVGASSECWCASMGELPLAIWGVVGVDADRALGKRVGVGWLLTGDAVDLWPLAFWKACKVILPDLFRRWDVIVNAIDARHERALRWAHALGFRLEPAVPFGAAQLPFHRFVATREDLHV